MEAGNEAVDQELEMESNADEMSEEELDLDILEQPNEEVEIGQKVWELATHMVLIHEYPFSMLDHVVFNKFMKAASPFYKKINRQTVREDRVTAYMLEKRRLRNILKGVIIADALSKCFLEWGIENKVSTINVDIASYSDVCIRRLKENFSLRKRWNNTYLMLVSALEFREVFSRYGDIDPGFYYVPKLYRINELLNEKALNFSDHIRSMFESMTQKFDNYCGESNLLMSLGAILDPRYKMVLVNHTFPVIYGEDAAPRYIDEIRRILYQLYNEYVDAYISSHSEEPQRKVAKRKHAEITSKSTQGAAKKFEVSVLTGKEKFQMIVSEIDKTPPKKSDLDVYLEESRYVCDTNANLDVLGWWKGERWRFPILSRMASGILAIPVTTVAIESTFSVGHRIIDDRHTSMLVEMVQMLLCGNDWIRNLYGLKKEPPDAPESSTVEEIDLPDI
ncbi:zinc finger BED domain-containing protein RICESLEEPER 2-like [Coffea arabica]|uniref:Zinc finger BED domain-containing protein RICESLEEPER 2-like n=1 Tax=Coffea arabica TaxID=13443 RepID=A0ABM4VC97_COFAR